MKKYLFFATAIATASLFTGCSNNEYVGDQPEAFNGTDGAIVFSMGKANTTRGTLDAATSAGKLGNTFYVYGTKNATSMDGSNSPVSNDYKVFQNYKVKYESAKTGTTSDNLRGWEYVGNYLERDNPTPNIGTGVDHKQTIKYWDYSANYYEFLAFSADADNLLDGKIKVKKDQGDKAYTVDIQEGANIEKLYFADYVKISKVTPNNPVQQDAENTYGGYVKFTFRNLAAKVRVGFYETVPGYKIQIKKMYAGANGSQTEKTDKFLADCPNTEASQKSKITVTYITAEGAAKNRAFVSDKKYADNTTQSLDAKNELTLGGGVFTYPLSNTSSSPTWDNGGNYTFFWPQEASNPLKITVDYTLTSTDNSGEKIEVKGATATVPADYVKWAANTAYTYIFKISDNTNGSTGEGAPEGLYPITFDALVQDYANEGFITTVSTPSVTAKQDGATNGYVTTDGIVFQKGKTIDLKVMNGNADVTSGAKITGDYITEAYDYNKTPDQNLTAHYKDITTEQSISLPLQNTKGYWVLKVATSSEQSAAFTYVIIRVDDAEVGPANPANP